MDPGQPLPLLLPPLLADSEAINNNERIFCARLIAQMAMKQADTLAVTNEQLVKLTGHNVTNTSLALSKLATVGLLHLTYKRDGRKGGTSRQIRLAPPLVASLCHAFGPRWADLITPAS